LRTEWIAKDELAHLLAALMPENRLALEVSMATGLRISDVLSLKVEPIMSTTNGRITVTEQKTRKNRRVYIPVELRERMLIIAGKYYVFQHRLDWKKHRTRQAVYKDLKRVVKIFRLKENVAPHSARKAFAVAMYHKTGDLYRVKDLLNHSDEAVTILYAMADELTRRRLGTTKH